MFPNFSVSQVPCPITTTFVSYTRLASCMFSAAFSVVRDHFCVSQFQCFPSGMSYYHDMRFIYPASFVHAFHGLLCSALSLLCFPIATAYYHDVRFISPASFVHVFRGLPCTACFPFVFPNFSD